VVGDRRRGQDPEEPVHQDEEKPTHATGRHAPHHKGQEEAQSGAAVEETATEPTRVRFTITARRVRIDPAEKRAEYIGRLERLIEQLDGMISSRGVKRKMKLRAMEVLIRTIGTCYGIVSDIEVEELEDELTRLKEENRRGEEEAGDQALGYTVEEDPAP